MLSRPGVLLSRNDPSLAAGLISIKDAGNKKIGAHTEQIGTGPELTYIYCLNRLNTSRFN